MGHDKLWPLEQHIDAYEEHDILDMIEFFYDHVSEPTDGRWHTYSNCGFHGTKFSSEKIKNDFRGKINENLKYYKEGYELSEDGNVLIMVDSGFENLLSADMPINDFDNVQSKIVIATQKFRKARTEYERRDAIKDLADILEWLRPQLTKVLKKTDEDTLFNIINNFGIRHHNQKQKTDYDKSIWYSWMFYFFLATIHAVSRFVKKHE